MLFISKIIQYMTEKIDITALIKENGMITEDLIMDKEMDIMEIRVITILTRITEVNMPRNNTFQNQKLR